MLYDSSLVFHVLIKTTTILNSKEVRMKIHYNEILNVPRRLKQIHIFFNYYYLFLYGFIENDNYIRKQFLGQKMSKSYLENVGLDVLCNSCLFALTLRFFRKDV